MQSDREYTVHPKTSDLTAERRARLRLYVSGVSAEKLRELVADFADDDVDVDALEHDVLVASAYVLLEQSVEDASNTYEHALRFFET